MLILLISLTGCLTTGQIDDNTGLDPDSKLVKLADVLDKTKAPVSTIATVATGNPAVGGMVNTIFGTITAVSLLIARNRHKKIGDYVRVIEEIHANPDVDKDNLVTRTIKAKVT